MTNSKQNLRKSYPMKIIDVNTSEVIWEYAIEVPGAGILVTNGVPVAAEDDENPSLEIGLINLDPHMKIVLG